MSVFDSDRFNDALFYPRRDVSPPPPEARDLTVEVPGATLHVRVHAADRAATPWRALLFHGNGEVVSDYDDLAALWARAGAALAVADFRGYGASTGTPTLRRTIEDAVPVLDAVRSVDAASPGDPRPIVVVGRSLGGACAAELCRLPRPGVAAYVFESAPADLFGIVRRRGLDVTPTADDRAVFDPLPKLAACRAPALVLHGDRDTLIAPREAHLSYEALAGTSRTLAWVPGRGHNDLLDSPSYWDAVRAFLSASRIG